MSKKKNNVPSSKPVVLRPSDSTASYLKEKTSINKKIASHRHRSR